MNLSVHTEEEYNALCRILDRKNIKYRVRKFELIIEIDEDSAKSVDKYAHERKEEISTDSAIPIFNGLTCESVRDLKIGQFFFWNSYKGAPIKWLKVSKCRAISAYILDNMAFGDNNNYATSNVRKWCNNLRAGYGINEDDIYIPSKKEIIRWFPTEELRKCDYSEEAKARGIDDGKPWYLLRTAIQDSSCNVRVVDSSGMFNAWGTHSSGVGVRPVLKIEG